MGEWQGAEDLLACLAFSTYVVVRSSSTGCSTGPTMGMRWRSARIALVAWGRSIVSGENSCPSVNGGCNCPSFSENGVSVRLPGGQAISLLATPLELANSAPPCAAASGMLS